MIGDLNHDIGPGEAAFDRSYDEWTARTRWRLPNRRGLTVKAAGGRLSNSVEQTHLTLVFGHVGG